MSKWNEKVERVKGTFRTCEEAGFRHAFLEAMEAFKEPERPTAHDMNALQSGETPPAFKESEPEVLECCNCAKPTPSDSPQCEGDCGALCEDCVRLDSKGVHLCPDCFDELKKSAKRRECGLCGGQGWVEGGDDERRACTLCKGTGVSEIVNDEPVALDPAALVDALEKAEDTLFRIGKLCEVETYELQQGIKQLDSEAGMINRTLGEISKALRPRPNQAFGNTSGDMAGPDQAPKTASSTDDVHCYNCSKLVPRDTCIGVGDEGVFVCPDCFDELKKSEGPIEKYPGRQKSCGCILCVCETPEKCLGCGARYCGKPDCVLAPKGFSSLVYKPGGRTWIWKDAPSCRGFSTIGQGIPLVADERYMTPMEAFRPGAVVRVEEGVYTLQGVIEHADPKGGGIYIRWSPSGANLVLHADGLLTLVKPAPVEEH